MWQVTKTGTAKMFDALHAYGLGVLIATATGKSVELTDSGICYTLRLTGTVALVPNKNLWLALWPFPDQQPNVAAENEFFLANWDGLLATLFTTPGIRVVSIADLTTKINFDSSVRSKAYTKVQKAIERLHQQVTQSAGNVETWLPQVLQHYQIDNLQMHVPTSNRNSGLSIPMTLDPTLSYAIRRPLSDGYLTERTNLSFSDSPTPIILAYLGAARFLRSQHVSGNLVNFYVPLFNTLKMHSDTVLPRLPSFAREARQATVYHWLEIGEQYGPDIGGLAYQTLQTQAAQQSISVELGYLNYTQHQLQQTATSDALTRYWKLLLAHAPKEWPIDLTLLVDALFTQRGIAWVAHLYDYGHQLMRETEVDLRPYHLHEVQGIIESMKEITSLQHVLKRQQGTLRFGRALRLLSRQNRGVVLDLTNELETIQHQYPLIRILGRIAQECQLASANFEFIIVPDEEDLTLLLEDVEKFGVRNIAGLLITLATLRYPSSGQSENQSTSSAMNGPITGPMQGETEL